tara:strand:- start:366 stop:4301 length:3936 start_codon:yes stop_codon:yes gene_type:complete
MKAIIFFILLTMLTIPTVFGQIKIGDNPQNIDPASVLELESTSKVLVITRVSTLEMEAIIPQRGGIVYNTDTECINYYDGTQWVNLCDAVNFTITNDPIVNNRATIEITQTEGGYNLEIAKNGILGDNIVDGGIGPDDIQDNSITQEKLAAESVGSSEIRQNAVGSDEIRDGSIAPTDMANFIPGQVLVTDENGIVKWGDAGDLMGAIGDEITITGSGTPASPLQITDGIQLNISNNSALIADHIVDDQDTDDTNELVDLTFTKLTNTLSISQSATPVGASVDLSGLIGSDDQQLTIDENILSLEEGGPDIDLTTYLDNTDEQTLNLAANDDLAISGGNTINLSKYIDNTDEQNLGAATLANEQLTITIDNGNPTTANLSAFATDAAVTTGLALKENIANKSNIETLGNSTDLYPTQNAVKVYVDTEISDIVTSGGSDPVNEQNQTFEVVAGELRITDVAGTLYVPLTDIDTNTQLTDAEIGAFGYIKTDNDNQTITDLSFDDPSSILSITIEGGNTETVNLGTLAGGTDGVVTLMELQGTDLVVTGTAPGFNGIVPLASLANIADGSETKINSTASITVVGDGTTGTPYELTAVTTNPIAADVIFTPVGNTTSNEVQAAIEELQTEIDGISLGGTANPNDELISDFTLNTTTLTITEAGVDWPVDLSSLEESADIAINIVEIDNLKDEQIIQNDAIALNTSKIGVTPAQATILANTSGTNTGDQDISGIATNTAAIAANDTDILDLQNEQITQNDAIALNTSKVGITPAQADILANTSGTNTGNQDISGIAINTASIVANDTDILDLQNEQIVQNDAIALNTSKVGITPAQAAILANTSGTNTGDQDISGIAINTAAIVANDTDILDLQNEQATQNDAIALNTAKTSITPAQADILTNTSGTNTGDQDISGIAINTAAIGTNATDIASKEDAANKSADITLADATNTLFPTELAVKTYVDNQVGAITAGNNLSNTNLTLNADRTHDLNGFNLVFRDNSEQPITGNVGIGNLPGAPQSKLDVSGQIQSRGGFASTGGSAGNPGYGFYTDDDTNTGMYRPAADEIGFSVGGEEALRMEEVGGNTNVIIYESLQLNNLLLDKDGESGTAGQILSSTGGQTNWINPPTGGGAINVNGSFTGDGDTTPLGIAAGAITGGTGGIIADGTLTADDLDANSVNTTELVNESVTTAKIEPGNNGDILTTVGGAVSWGAPTIRAMGKVDVPATNENALNSNVTRNGLGTYTVTFTAPMTDDGYIINLTVSATGGTTSPPVIKVTNQTTTSFTVEILSIDTGNQNNFILTDAVWFYSVMGF